MFLFLYIVILNSKIMRKTNLFYSQGQDSNFVTFSNYTEALTGVVIATDYKLFPSKFICVYIPKLEGENFAANKAEFITSYLGGYYENKLAVIRDWCIKENKNLEQNINPLDYLLHTIAKYDPDYRITFVSDICEQDYNGTFMDNICIIENNAPVKKYVYTPSLSNDDQIDVEDIVPDKYKDITGWENKLYGWANATAMPEGFDETEPIYDVIEDTIYCAKTTSTITEQEIGDEEANDFKSIKFNVLIPLYDVFKYFKYDDGTISENPIDNTKPDEILILDGDSKYNQYDIPIGMWFSDKVIELERATQTTGQSATYRPSWSLCISSQFKPFP